MWFKKNCLILTVLVSLSSIVLLENMLTRPAHADETSQKHWVISDWLNRRTCPSTQCGVVGKLVFREAVTIFEEKDGWARITKLYNGGCVDGMSEYVDSGNASCNAVNGIVNGKLAEWVSVKHLSKTRPQDLAKNAGEKYRLVSQSDDFRKYKEVFAKTATEMMQSGKCSANHFLDNGGWIKSTHYANQPIYFTYCGNYKKYHLNAATGKVF